MSITREEELEGMKKAGEAVAQTLKAMVAFAKAGMSTKTLDEFGAKTLAGFGAKSAPYLTYGFPGYTCISVNEEFCHGIPSENRILKNGDLINIDVSAELNGYWADNGSSFVIGGEVSSPHQKLVNASKEILRKALQHITDGARIADVGQLMQTEARKRGYSVIKNLGGHGIGRALHEQPDELLNYKNRFDRRKFKKNMVVAIETFISTDSSFAKTLKDGWTMIGDKGGFMAQHEHTIIVTDKAPIVLTGMNDIFRN